MTTVYRGRGPGSQRADQGYTTYREPDTSVPPKARPVLDRISVNGVEIPQAEILAEAQNHPADTPGAALMGAARALVVRQLLVQRAMQAGTKGERGTVAGGSRQTHEEAAIDALVEREVSAPCAGEEECRRYYDANRDKFRSDTIYEARHILIAASPDDPPARRQARAVAEKLIAKLGAQPGAFGGLAGAHSDCPSAANGGNLGQITRGSTVAEFERALETMSEGEISKQPVESRYGFHIIGLDRKIEGELLAFDLVRERIAAWLEAAAWSKAVSQYIRVLAADADIRGIDLDAAEGPLLQ